MASGANAPKMFSTAARVYPPLQLDTTAIRQAQTLASPKVPRVQGAPKWVLPAVAVCAIGAAIAADQVGQSQRQRESSEKSTADAQRRRNEALMNAYGDKQTLADVEKARRYYESR